MGSPDIKTCLAPALDRTDEVVFTDMEAIDFER